MEKFIIKGGTPLKGEVQISGAKNAAVAIIPAAILAADKCVLENVPSISDVEVALEILSSMGAEIKRLSKSKIEVDTSRITDGTVPYDLARSTRGSSYFLGALLGRFKKASVPLPGGCDLGSRPIDQHIKCFEALGAKADIKHGIVDLSADKLIGTQIYFDKVTVGGTINALLACAQAEGLTIIENAAKEPHIVDLANFLNSMGADIMGAGTDVIKVKGVSKLHGTEYSVIPDQIEAGTFMVAAAATCGDITLKNVIPKHLEPITAKLRKIGVYVEIEDETDNVRVVGRPHYEGTDIKTSGEAYIEVYSEQRQDSGTDKVGYAVLHIKDNGIGIPAKDIDKVFIKSYTGSNGRNNAKSTGMGLYIAKNMCGKLGHNIEIKSIEGEYTSI